MTNKDWNPAHAVREFIYGFAKAAGIDINRADEQWAGFSRQLTDTERARIELQGWDSGWEQGNNWRKIYGTE